MTGVMKQVKEMSNPLKTLMEHNDVFADYMNVMIFHGEQVIDPDDLEDVDRETIRKKDGKYPDEDMICKFWTKGGIILRLRGFDEGLALMQNMFGNGQKQKVNKSDCQNVTADRKNQLNYESERPD